MDITKRHGKLTGDRAGYFAVGEDFIERTFRCGEDGVGGAENDLSPVRPAFFHDPDEIFPKRFHRQFHDIVQPEHHYNEVRLVREDILTDAPQCICCGMAAASGIDEGQIRLRMDLPDRLAQQFTVSLATACVVIQARDAVPEDNEANLFFP